MMVETAVDLTFEKISVIYAYAFQVQIERPPQIDRHQAAVHPSGKEMIFVMTITIMQDATLMVETAVDLMFGKTSVVNVYVLLIPKGPKDFLLSSLWPKHNQMDVDLGMHYPVQ